MTKMKPLHVELCLETYTKNIIFVLCLSISLSATDRNRTERNGTERIGTKNQTTQLCWNINDKVFNQSVFD